jgi:tRNA threonylcarbamoyladenosine biosynthesis protein TsaB
VLILAIESSAKAASAALCRDGEILSHSFQRSGLTHSATLLPMIDGMLRCAGIEKNDVDAVAVARGPGSFTGVRIGVSTVKALAHATGRPCIAVDALEAMAAGVQPYEGVICPIQDARAGQVYGAAFRGGDLSRLLPDEPIKLEEYLEKVSAFGRPMLFLGDGMPVHRAAIAGILGEKARFAPPHLAFLRPAAAAFLAWNRLDQAVPYQNLSPLYLRPPQAERQRNLREIKP